LCYQFDRAASQRPAEEAPSKKREKPDIAGLLADATLIAAPNRGGPIPPRGVERLAEFSGILQFNGEVVAPNVARGFDLSALPILVTDDAASVLESLASSERAET
jgi:hypothetical protein